MQLGDECIIRNIHIETEGSQSITKITTQNWSGANARFIDVPLLHADEEQGSYRIFQEEIQRAFHDQWDLLRETLNKGFAYLGPIVPTAWEGKALSVPIDFIALRNFRPLAQGKAPMISMDVQLGHHLIFWQLPVIEENGSLRIAPRIPPVILNKEILGIIEGLLLAKNEAIEIFRDVCDAQRLSEGAIGDGIPGYNPEKIPPPIEFR
jgi:hypothetical protein